MSIERNKIRHALGQLPIHRTESDDTIESLQRQLAEKEAKLNTARAALESVCGIGYPKVTKIAKEAIASITQSKEIEHG